MVKDEQGDRALAHQVSHAVTDTEPAPADSDEQMVFRHAKRVGQVIAVLADPSPGIDEWMPVIRRGMEAGRDEMLEVLGHSSRSTETGGEDVQDEPG